MTLFFILCDDPENPRDNHEIVCDLKGLREYFYNYDFEYDPDDEQDYHNAVLRVIQQLTNNSVNVYIIKLNHEVRSQDPLTAKQIFKIITNPLPAIAVAHTFPKTKGSRAAIKNIPLDVLRKLNEFL
jgi:hypothetical protein